MTHANETRESNSINQEILEFRVTPSYAKNRLDKFLVCMVPSWISRTMIQRAIKEKKVLVEGTQKKPAYLVQENDVVSIEVPTPPITEILPENLPISIVYEDPDLVVINKPPGMIVHPVPHKTTGTLVNALLFHCQDFQWADQGVRPGIVHRLDKDTSGVMVVAKNINAHHYLSNQFRFRKTKKEYFALVKGILSSKEGTIERPLSRSPNNRLKMMVNEEGKESFTSWKVLLEIQQKISLVFVRIRTGRMHQIRVHFKSINHPIVGDYLYGDLSDANIFHVQRQMLHAVRLGIFHPTSNQWMEFTAPIPADLSSFLRKAYRNLSPTD